MLGKIFSAPFTKIKPCQLFGEKELLRFGAFFEGTDSQAVLKSLRGVDRFATSNFAKP